jgi:hypothetical protein
MIPKTYPSKIIGSNTACVIAEITPGPNDVAWETYIPVKSVTSSKINRYDADGSIGVSVLSSLTGKTSWIDYIPVFRVITSNPWRTDTDGHIPVEVLEGSFVGFILLETGSDFLLQETGTFPTRLRLE